MLITLLDTAIQDQSIQPGPNITVLELANVLRKIQTLKALFIQFEDIQEHSAASPEVQDVAMELITQTHDLASQTKLNLALNSSKRLNPEQGKIARVRPGRTLVYCRSPRSLYGKSQKLTSCSLDHCSRAIQYKTFLLNFLRLTVQTCTHQLLSGYLGETL